MCYSTSSCKFYHLHILDKTSLCAFADLPKSLQTCGVVCRLKMFQGNNNPAGLLLNGELDILVREYYSDF